MKRFISNQSLRFFIIQLLTLGLFIATWSLITSHVEPDIKVSGVVNKLVSRIFFALWFVFAINYYLLVPKLLFSQKNKVPKRVLFVVLQIAKIIFLDLGRISFVTTIDGFVAKIGSYSFVGLWAILNITMIGLAIGRRYYEQKVALKEKLLDEQRKHTEAELAWLKNQLNPHFLFNTLNNISSLVQINPDEAQDKIGQFSDLLRYVLYETKHQMIPLHGEIEFMENYIALMSLRCGSNVDIKTDFQVLDSTVEIAPMLFLSPLENAFKHGVSSSNLSFIHISLRAEAGRISFYCENSNYPKDNHNRSGSGIGLENLERRLELLYYNHYSFKQKLVDGIYKTSIEIWKN